MIDWRTDFENMPTARQFLVELEGRRGDKGFAVAQYDYYDGFHWWSRDDHAERFDSDGSGFNFHVTRWAEIVPPEA